MAETKEIQRLRAELASTQARIDELEADKAACGGFAMAAGMSSARSLSDDYLRCLLATIPDMVWLKGTDGVYLACNEAFERFFGAKEADIVGKTDYDFVSSDLAEFFRDHDRRAIKAGKPCVNEEWVTMADSGAKVLLETIKKPMHDGLGRLIGVLGIARDITKRKRIEQALERRMVALTAPLDDMGDIEFDELFNLQEIQTIQDQFSDATGVASIITQPDGTPITKPSNFCALCKDIIRKTSRGEADCMRLDAELGRFHPDGAQVRPCHCGLWNAGAAITVGGRHVASWLIGQARDEARGDETVRRYAQEIGVDEETMVSAYTQVPAMSGKRFNNVAQALFTLANRLSDGAFQNIQQARFINDRKRAEAELIELQNNLSDIINSMPSAIVGVDKNGLVTQWNNEMSRVTGVSDEAALGLPLEQSVPDLAGLMSRVHEAMASRNVFVENRHAVDENGEARHEEITVFPLVESGEQGAVIRIDDVTTRVNLEQMMVQTEKMMSVGGLAAGMAHEINNPLAGMLQGIQIVAKRLSPDLPANAEAARSAGIDLDNLSSYMEARGLHRTLAGIRESGKRAAVIVRNMLDFSRKSSAMRSECNLVELLDTTLEIASNDYDLKKKYDFKSVEVVREYDQEAFTVACVPSELEQVFLNLFKNAAQAMASRTNRDTVARLHIRTRKQGENVVVEIEDNGPGIDPETSKRIFDPFFTTKGPDVGTGLGLSVSYFIITQNHGGTIKVITSPGEGATFVITLPQKNVFEDEARA